MSYFSHFGSVWFTLENGNQVVMNDITKFASFIDKYKSNPTFFLDYLIHEGERPEQISEKLYGTRRFWWTIILVNDLYQFDDQWPMTDEVLDKYVTAKYPEQDYADIIHYVDENGNVADPRALAMVYKLSNEKDAIATFALTPVTIGDYEFAANQKKRQIKLINANMINDVEASLKEEFQ